MNIVFIGTPEFAVPTFHRLLHSPHKICAAVTSPDRPAGRGLQLRPSPIKQAALAAGIPLLQPDDLGEASFREQLTRLQPDAGVVVAFRILPPELYTIPRRGCINLHASLLPDLRGAAPINWALMRGYSRTGVTTFRIDRKVDTGDLLLQRATDIRADDDAGSLSQRLSELGAELMLETLNRLESGNIIPQPQQGKSSGAPKITRETCLIDWTRPAVHIHNRIRGLAPEPAAFSYVQGKVLKLYRSRILGTEAVGKPGQLLGLQHGCLAVCTGDGVLGLCDVQLEGRKRMSAESFWRGTSGDFVTFGAKRHYL